MLELFGFDWNREDFVACLKGQIIGWRHQKIIDLSPKEFAPAPKDCALNVLHAPVVDLQISLGEEGIRTDFERHGIPRQSKGLMSWTQQSNQQQRKPDQEYNPVSDNSDPDDSRGGQALFARRYAQGQSN